MPNPLSLQQLTALQRLFEQYDSRTALESFINSQYEYHSTQCAEEMVNKRNELAQEHAYFARCYRTMLNELKQFVQKQIEQR